jgi:hypothetical protein
VLLLLLRRVLLLPLVACPEGTALRPSAGVGRHLPGLLLLLLLLVAARQGRGAGLAHPVAAPCLAGPCLCGDMMLVAECDSVGSGE